MGRKAPKNPPLYERAKTGNLVACPGEAHSNPYIDNCSLCAPRWGQIEEREPKLSLDRLLTLVHEGYDVSCSDVDTKTFQALYDARVPVFSRTDKTGYGAVTFNVYRIAK